MTRSAQRAAAVARHAQYGLAGLSGDELEVIFEHVSRAVDPRPALALSATSKAMRVPLQLALLRLKARHEQATAVLAKAYGSPCCAQGRAAVMLSWGGTGLAADSFEAVGRLGNELPQLERLDLCLNRCCGGEGVPRWAAALGAGALPALKLLHLGAVNIGVAGAAALAAAFGRGAMPRLMQLYLYGNPIMDEGMIDLAPRLGSLPDLVYLEIEQCQLGDDAVAALVAPPTSGVGFQSLQKLFLNCNQISNDGCAALASAIKGGALPAIELVALGGCNPACEAAKEAVSHVIAER